MDLFKGEGDAQELKKGIGVDQAERCIEKDVRQMALENKGVEVQEFRVS